MTACVPNFDDVGASGLIQALLLCIIRAMDHGSSSASVVSIAEYRDRATARLAAYFIDAAVIQWVVRQSSGLPKNATREQGFRFLAAVTGLWPEEVRAGVLPWQVILAYRLDRGAWNRSPNHVVDWPLPIDEAG